MRDFRLAAMMLMWTACCQATVYHVPSPAYPTIQAGLDSVTAGDTVMVALGIYAEELTAPALPFLLKGNVIPDTGEYPRPEIDPSTLSDPTTRHCLLLPSGSAVTIEDMVLRNGAEMYPRPAEPTPGGIVNRADWLSLKRCVFDSTYQGISGVGQRRAILMDSCRFHHNYGTCASGYPLMAHACEFEGYGSPWLVGAVGESILDVCVFRHLPNPQGGGYWFELLVSNGPHVVVRNCLFGPTFGEYAAIAITGGTLFEDNVFQGIGAQVSNVIDMQVCGTSGDSAALRGNDFVSDHGMIGVHTLRPHPCSYWPPILIEDNTFEACSSSADSHFTFVGKAIDSEQSPITVRHNRFLGLRPNYFPAVDAYLADSVNLRKNIFEDNGWGVESSGGFVMDARWNWWGDSTGPSNENNPSGLGDSVGANVLFDPWCVDTVVCEEPSSARTRFIPRPSSVRLSVYPNPFNSTTRLRLEVPSPAIVSLELFNVLGQRVEETWSGAVAYEKEISFDAASLSSGTYVVRATNVIGNRMIAQTKLVVVK